MRDVLWITVDSMRTYPSELDDRGVIPFFEKFSRDGVSFSNCYCSAPSTVMSVSSMMTAVPAVYHSTCYDHFDKNSFGFESLPNWFKDNGYRVGSVVFFPEGREHLTHLMGDTLKKHWPKGKSSLFWSNRDIYSVFSSALNSAEQERPCFFYVHFNLRHDPTTNFWVEKCYERFKTSVEDPLIILTSDHGYPDPKHGIKAMEMVYHGHDLLLTDDNVRVPLAIQGLRGLNKGATNDNLVSLIDIAPTIQKAIKPTLKNTINDNFFDCGTNILQPKRRSLEIYNRYIFQNNMKIKFVRENQKLIFADKKFEIEENFSTCDYQPNDADLDYVRDKLEKIDRHFRQFMNEKAKLLPKNSIIFCSKPPQAYKDFFSFQIANGIRVIDDVAHLDPERNIFICKSSDNVFQTIRDYKKVRSVVGRKVPIGCVSLNFEIIPIERSKIRAIASLFFRKFLPRFIKSPSHTILETVVVLKRL